MARVAPLVSAYLRGKPVLTTPVVLKWAIYFRPLCAGVDKAILAWLGTQPEALDCGSTVLKDAISLILALHATQRTLKRKQRGNTVTQLTGIPDSGNFHSLHDNGQQALTVVSCTCTFWWRPANVLIPRQWRRCPLWSKVLQARLAAIVLMFSQLLKEFST